MSLTSMKLMMPLTMIVLVVLGSCKTKVKDTTATVTVSNDLDFQRSEIVSVTADVLSKTFTGSDMNHIRVKKTGTEDYLRTQWIDYNQDGINEEFLFPADVPAKSSEDYIVLIDSTRAPVATDIVAYSRLVPERTDDYTWENDKVAFRTYGPSGEKGALAGVRGSSLSSGIDLWLKRTPKSIINKWYKGYLTNSNFYHEDIGEGYDPYHVGKSRGTGGIGIWKDGDLLVSNNFTDSRTIADGPLRTVFELDYAPWSEYDVQETKRITLDLGSNFSKFDISLSSTSEVPNYTIGITLHKNEGEFDLNSEEGIFRHWETIHDYHLGEGIVIDPNVVTEAIVNTSKEADKSSILIQTKPQSTLSYYAGFGWERSEEVNTLKDWEDLLAQQSEIRKSPLDVSLKQK